MTLLNHSKLKKNQFLRFILYPYINMRRKKAGHFLTKLNAYYDCFLERVVSGSITVEFADFLGSFELDIRSSLLKRNFLYNDYEQKLAQIADVLVDPKKDVIDVGANIGLFTILFSNTHRRITAMMRVF